MMQLLLGRDMRDVKQLLPAQDLDFIQLYLLSV